MSQPLIRACYICTRECALDPRLHANLLDLAAKRDGYRHTVVCQDCHHRHIGRVPLDKRAGYYKPRAPDTFLAA